MKIRWPWKREKKPKEKASEEVGYTYIIPSRDYTPRANATFCGYSACMEYLSNPDLPKDWHFFIHWQECEITPDHVDHVYPDSKDKAFDDFRELISRSFDYVSICERNKRLVYWYNDGIVKAAFPGMQTVFVDDSKYCSFCGTEDLGLDISKNFRYFNCICHECYKKLESDYYKRH